MRAAPGCLQETPRACHEAAMAPALPDTHATTGATGKPRGSPSPVPQHGGRVLLHREQPCLPAPAVPRAAVTRGRAGAARPHWPGDGDPGGSAGAWRGRLSAGRAGGPGARLRLAEAAAMTTQLWLCPERSCAGGGHSTDPLAALPPGPAVHRGSSTSPRRCQGEFGNPARHRAAAPVRNLVVKARHVDAHVRAGPLKNTKTPSR